ncbi:flagellar protein FliT [Propionivibrio sp.]|uniref:flagellar protein FliT n=1 Tax=Propionivibrio sp. TaxID=2212460 RepID=UPI003BEFC054
MEIERQYLAVLDLTHQMFLATNAQDWDELTRLELQRTQMVAALPTISSKSPLIDPALARRIAEIIVEIERENTDIVEQVQVWQKHVKILLRLDKPATV